MKKFYQIFSAGLPRRFAARNDFKLDFMAYTN